MVAWPDGRVRPLLFDGSPLLPSAVCAEPGAPGSSTLLVGRDAVQAARIEPSRFEAAPKRRVDDGTVLLGEQEFPVSALIGAVLARVSDEAARVLGGPPREVVLSHPAAWGISRRLTLLEAAKLAGLGEPTLVPEPVAAARYFAEITGDRFTEGNGVLVYDFGGGTFDASLVVRSADGYDVRAIDGIDDLGGLDLDELIVEYVGKQIGTEQATAWQQLISPASAEHRRHRRMLWDDARVVKERLSRAETTALHVPLADVDVTVARTTFEDLSRSLIERTARTTAAVLRWSKLPKDRLTGVFLVGGSSRIPLVATLLERELGLAPTVLEQPELVVAEGALRQGSDRATHPGQPAASAAPISAPPISPAPISGPPISPASVNAAPISAPPISPAPVSPAPVNAAPVNATPISAPPVSPAPISASPVSAAPTGPAPTSVPPQGETAPLPRVVSVPPPQQQQTVIAQPGPVRQQYLPAPISPPRYATVYRSSEHSGAPVRNLPAQWHPAPEPAPVHTPAPTPARTRHWWPPFLAALFVLAVVAAAYAVLNGPGMGTITGTNGQSASASPSSITKINYQRRDRPEWLPSGWQVTVSQDADRLWNTGDEPEGGRCETSDRTLHVTRPDSTGLVGCTIQSSLDQVFYDVAVEADISVTTGCAGLWARTGAKGYMLAVCESSVVLLRLGSGSADQATLGQWRLGFRPEHTIAGLLVEGTNLSVRISGQLIGSVISDNQIHYGKVNAGGYPGQGTSIDVSITDLRVFTPLAAGAPTAGGTQAQRSGAPSKSPSSSWKPSTSTSPTPPKTAAPSAS